MNTQSVIICAAVSLLLDVCARGQEPERPNSRQAAPAAAGFSSMEGSVVSTTGQPLAGVNLRLRPAGAPAAPPGAGGAATSALGAKSGADGKFMIVNIPPGKYYLWAQRNGYTGISYGSNTTTGGRIFEITSDGRISGLVVALAPEGKLGGLVVDEEGEPVPTAMVQVLRIGYVNGLRQLLPAGSGGVRPDGSFLIGGLPAGRYYIKAIPDPRQLAPMGYSDSAGDGHGTSRLPTFFPGATEAAAAAAVPVSPGAEVTGLKIAVQQGATFEIRGSVVTEAGEPPSESIAMSLIPATRAMDVTATLDQRLTTTDQRTGAFAFRDVPPGAYVVRTFAGRMTGAGVASESRAVGVRHRSGGQAARWERSAQ